jgi:gliding motility-associated-like protein
MLHFLRTYPTLLSILLLVGRISYAFGNQPPIATPPVSVIKLIENKGQWDPQVICKANIPGGDLFITQSGIVYALVDEVALHNKTHNNNHSASVKGHNYKMVFSGAHAKPNIVKINPSSETYNYFIGNDKNKWASNCLAFEKIVLHNIYDGIDAEIVAQSDYIKLNFIVSAGANPNLIKLTYTGADALAIKDEALHITTTVATVKEEKPIAFQQSGQISCAYNLKGNQVSFSMGKYNHTSQLIIDPNIIFGTYSGSVADNFGFTGTYDNLGNGFAGGAVYSAGFPVTLGAYQLFFAGGVDLNSSARDVGILKFSANGKQLLYATYLGGSHNEQPHSIICNPNGNLYILGTTESTDFPMNGSGIDKTQNGQTDIFIARLSTDGSQLLSSTYWGGGKDDGINGHFKDSNYYRVNNPLTYNYGDFFRGEIKLDPSNNVLVATSTQSSTAENYPIRNAFQPFFGGNQDGCVFKLSADLATIVFSSYIGGSGEDAAFGLTIDASNTLFVCGGTTSSNLGKNQGSLNYKGDVDGYIAKINAFGNSLIKLVYIGTPQYDQSYFIENDAESTIYITGQTLGVYPIKGNVYSKTNGKHFISILNNNLDSIQYSTVFGNGASEICLSPSAFMVDQCGKVYFSGWGGNGNIQFHQGLSSTQGLETTPTAFQPNTDGSDFYLMVLGKNLATLTYATFLGGTFSSDHVDGGTSRFDKKGIIYQSICAGCGGYSDLPTTDGAYSKINKGKRPNSGSGGCNNALVKFNADPSDNPPIIKDTFIQLVASDTLNYSFTIQDPDGDSVSATFTGNIFSLNPNPLTITTNKGKNNLVASLNWKTLCEHIGDTFTINITAKDNGCLTPKTSIGYIKLLVTAPPVLIPPYPECLQTINDSTISIKWTEVGIQRYFKHYSIYKSTGQNPFELFGNSSNQSNMEIIDNKAKNHLTNNICYYFRVVNSCDSVSIPSRTICSLYPYDSAAAIFKLPVDTILYVTATDTLNYTFKAETINPQDSAFISMSGNIVSTNRVLSIQAKPQRGLATFSFQWKSICEDVTIAETLYVSFFVRDNMCPQSRTVVKKIPIIVIPPPPIAAPIMRCIRPLNSNSALVRWEKPNINKRYFSHFVLIRKDAQNNWTELKKVYSDDAFEITDLASINNSQIDYCYTAYAVNICNKIGDTASFTCTVNRTNIGPAPIYIYTTTVNDNKRIMTTWAKSKETDFLCYKILRQLPSTQSDFTLYKTSDNINDTVLIDEQVDVQRNVYCYEIRQINDCGIENKSAFRSCSILLKGKSIPFSHSLVWNDFDFYKNGLEQYQVEKIEPSLAPIVFTSTKYKQTLTTDNRLNKDNGLYYYTIIANEINSSFSSTSNTIELIQAPLLHVPNAFTPNDDGINDIWKPIPVFVKEYNLALYNRWGQKIFETQDKYHVFSDTFMNDPAIADVFVYVITYTGWDGTSKTVTGNVTLLK